MSDYAEIERLLARKSGQRAVLVTLIRVEGSSYRKPGARMVVADDGEAAGAISGGCLETLLRAHAIETLDQESHTFAIDTTLDTDLIFGHGLGCPGKLQFLVEPFHAGSEPEALGAWRKVHQDRTRRIVVTLLTEDGRPVRRGLTPMVRDDAAALQSIARNAKGTGCVAEGGRQWFVEVIDPPLRLLLIGSGLDVPPFVKLAESAGLQVTQVAKTKRDGAACLVAAPEDIAKLEIDTRTAVVVMTHNYLADLDYLRALLPASPMYIGVIGSKGRFHRLLNDLQSEGFASSRLQKIKGPAGLDIGAETPAQIAISIVAEIQAVAAGRRMRLEPEQTTSGSVTR